MRIFARRHLPILLLVLALAAPLAVEAAPVAAEAQGAQEGAFVAALRQAAPQVWAWLTSLWDRAGSYIDPSGGTAPGEPAPDHAEGDEGSYIDPNGAR